MPDLLRAAIIIDYQNIHLTARDAFKPGQRPGDWVVDPISFAIQAIKQRNRRQRPGHPYAEISSIEVYRGLPSHAHDPLLAAAAQAQRDKWSRHPAATIHYRPITYRTVRGRLNREEKGVDVLCAMALVRASLNPDIDVAILASHDSDLIPALDEALKHGRVETLGWMNFKKLRPETGRCWDTRLGYEDFEASLDVRNYFPED